MYLEEGRRTKRRADCLVSVFQFYLMKTLGNLLESELQKLRKNLLKIGELDFDKQFWKYKFWKIKRYPQVNFGKEVCDSGPSLISYQNLFQFDLYLGNFEMFQIFIKNSKISNSIERRPFSVLHDILTIFITMFSKIKTSFLNIFILKSVILQNTIFVVS